MHKPIFFILLSLLIWPPLLAAFEDPYDKYRYNREETFDYDDSQDKPWREDGTAIPHMPDPDAMQQVPIDGLGDDFTVFIDPASLSIGKDRVVRYWLLLRSKLGAVNIMYEGLRCTTHEYKTYAYSSKRERRGFKIAGNPKWMSVKAIRGVGFRHELDQFFCNYGMPRTTRDILLRIRDAGKGLNFGRDSSGPAAFF